MARAICARLVSSWQKMGHWMGHAFALCALSVLFFLVVTPMAWIWKLIGKDPMQRKFNKNQKSYFEHSQPLDPDHWTRPS